MSTHAADLIISLSTPQLLGLSFSIMGCAWLWTAWDCFHNGRYLAPLRWYTAYSPATPAIPTTPRTPGVWDIQDLNACHLPRAVMRRAAAWTSPTAPRCPFRVSEPWLHPAGIYPATLAGWEETRDDYGIMGIRWLFQSRFEDPTGGPIHLPYRTSPRIRPRNEMGRLLQACRLPLPTSDIEAERLDPERLMGTECLVRVKHRHRSRRRLPTERVAVICDVLPWTVPQTPARDASVQVNEPD
jgi:hypothetical protein